MCSTLISHNLKLETMFKKLPLYLIVVLFATVSYAQTIVSTSPQNKNVILEEFTGIHCVYCPQGHAIAQAIQDANPDRVSLINIHVGGFAVPSGNEPDFRTPFGTAIANQTGLTGYPSGTVNRHIFSGNKTILDRGQWTARATQTMAMASYVNVGLTAEIDPSSNMMNIHVEAYYTGNSPVSTNKLNVVLLQNNTKGPQTGGGQGNNYNHMHRLIDMVTGQWGEDITQTTAGTFVDRTFDYSIPCDINGIPVEIGDLEVVAFVAETTQEIVSGNRFTPTVTVTSNNDASLRCLKEFPVVCLGPGASITPEVNLQNLGSDPLTSLNIGYNINGTTGTYTWTGNIASLKSENITLPEIIFDGLPNNSFEISLPNDDNNGNNSKTIDFGSAVGATGIVNMELHVDENGSQTRWYVYDSSGATIYNGGPYPNGNPQVINETFTLTPDCYQFRIYDIASNGGGEITVRDHHGVLIYHSDGNYGKGETIPFSSDGNLGVTQNQLENISLFPNPASSTINVANAENADIQIFDILGKLIHSQNNISMNAQINVSQLQAGTYFMKISKDNQVATKKFVILK